MNQPLDNASGLSVDAFGELFIASLPTQMKQLREGMAGFNPRQPEPKRAGFTRVPSSSMIGDCARKISYMLNPEKYPPQEIGLEGMLWLHDCNISHDLIQGALYGLCKAQGWGFDYERRITWAHKRQPGLSGAYDGLISIGKAKILVEIKNANPASYKRIDSLEKLYEYYPKYRHQNQANMMLTKADRCFIIFRMKPEYPGKSSVLSFRFFEDRYDPEWKQGWLIPRTEMLRAAELAEPEYTSKSTRSPCKYCPYNHICEGKQEDISNDR